MKFFTDFIIAGRATTVNLRSEWAGLAAALLLGVVLIWIFGDKFPAGNNLYHVPLVLDYANSVEGPHDAFHHSLQNFVSWFWRGVAAAASEDNIQPLFLVLLLGTSALTLAGAYALVRVAGARPGLALIGCAMAGIAFGARQFMEFGGGELLAGFLTHSQVATAIGLFAMTLAITRRWVWCAMLCGLVANVNLFLGFWLMVNTCVARLMLDRIARAELAVKSIFLMSAACLAAAMPTIAWALQATGAGGPLEFSFREYLYEFHPYHFFVHLELWLLLSFAALAAAVWIAADALASGERIRTLAMLVVGSLATILLGAAAAETIDSQRVLSLHPLRYAAVGHWLAALAVIALWAQEEERDSESAAFGAIAVTGFFLPTPAVTILGLVMMIRRRAIAGYRLAILLLGLAVSLVTPAYSEGRFEFPLMPYVGSLPVLTIVCALSALIVFARTDGNVWMRWRLLLLIWLTACASELGDKLLTLPFSASVMTLTVLLVTVLDRPRLAISAGLLATSCLVASIYHDEGTAWRMLITFAVTLALALVGVLACRARLYKPHTLLGVCAAVLLTVNVVRAQAARQGFDFPHWSADDAWFDVQAWARANTTPDTLFYAPGRFGFATMSRRPVWWDPGQGAAVMWSPEFYGEWSSRKRRAEQAEASGQLLELARAEGIRFVVLECEAMGSLQGATLRYRNHRYCVSEVDDARSQ